MIQIRPAHFEDYNAIAKLHADSWRRTYRGILSDHYLDHEVEQDRLKVWHERLLSPSDNQLILVATTADMLAGFCCVYMDHDPTFGSLIDNLHVTSGMQKSGVGKKLVQEAAKYINDHARHPKTYLWVYESNYNARLAYEKLGGTHFETIDKQNNDGTVSRSCRIVWDDVSKVS
jgi:ribosomal protein S18 acetylase RimI-like enzyme